MMKIEDAPKWRRFTVEGDNRVFIIGKVEPKHVTVIEFKDGYLGKSFTFSKGSKITLI